MEVGGCQREGASANQMSVTPVTGSSIARPEPPLRITAVDSSLCVHPAMGFANLTDPSSVAVVLLRCFNFQPVVDELGCYWIDLLSI